MRTVFHLAAVLVAAGMLGGCGKPQIAPEVEAVRLTYTESQIASCTSRGLLQASNRNGGFFYKGMARRAVERSLKEQAHRKGGTLVYVRTFDN
jgi:hypothetical protein